MVFESLDLKKKFKSIFKKNIRGGVNDDDGSISETDTRRSGSG